MTRTAAALLLFALAAHPALAGQVDVTEACLPDSSCGSPNDFLSGVAIILVGSAAFMALRLVSTSAAIAVAQLPVLYVAYKALSVHWALAVTALIGLQFWILLLHTVSGALLTRRKTSPTP